MLNQKKYKQIFCLHSCYIRKFTLNTIHNNYYTPQKKFYRFSSNNYRGFVKDLLKSRSNTTIAGNHSPVIQQRNFAIVIGRIKSNRVDQNNNQLDNLESTHPILYDDVTQTCSTALTRSPTGPNGIKNQLISKNLINPKKSLHPAGKGQYAAITANPLNIPYAHFNPSKDIDIILYATVMQVYLKRMHYDNMYYHLSKQNLYKTVQNANTTQKTNNAVSGNNNQSINTIVNNQISNPVINNPVINSGNNQSNNQMNTLVNNSVNSSGNNNNPPTSI